MMSKSLIEVHADTGFAHPTVAQLASLAGSKAEIAKACGVSLRTVGAWRSGLVDKVPFRAVVAMCLLGGYEIGEIDAG